MSIRFNFLRLLAFFAVMYVVASCTKTYITPLFKIKVVNIKDTTQNIIGAVVNIQNQKDSTDSHGETKFSIDLDRFILDRIEVSSSAAGFKDYKGSILVGKDQQETGVLKMEPRDKLIFTPDSIVIGANATSADLQIENLGLSEIKTNYYSNFSWINLSATTGLIPPSPPEKLNIGYKIIPNQQQNCRVDGTVIVNWGTPQISNTIHVTKIFQDNSPPYAAFTVAPGTTVQQNDVVKFDASISNDNCKAFFPLQYSWDFENTGNWTIWSTESKAEHVYSNIGSTVVRLQVKDGAGNINTPPASKDIKVTIKPTPPAICPIITVTKGSKLLSVNVSFCINSCGNTFNELTDYGIVGSTSIDMPTTDNGGKTLASLGAYSDNQLPNTFTVTVNDLQPTKWHFRAYAKNASFSSYSDPFDFPVDILDLVPVGGNGGGLNAYSLGDNNSTFSNQKPQVQVILNNFMISQTEVTNEQYVAFLNGSALLPGSPQVYNYIQYSPYNNTSKIRYLNKWEVFPGFEKYPVVDVSWEGAVAFCNWVGGRLPTEAEWEAAARGKVGAIPHYPEWAGSTIPPPDNVAVYNSGGLMQLLEVKSRLPNGLFMIYDMSGNVKEWCADWYAPNYSIPTGPNPQGPANGDEKVCRGGSFMDDQLKITVTYRGHFIKELQSPEIGFRVVK